MKQFENLQDMLEPYPWSYPALIVSTLLLTAWFVNWILKRLLLRGVHRLLRALPLTRKEDNEVCLKLAPRIANIAPALIISVGAEIVPGIPESLLTVIQKVCGSFVILTVSLALSTLLELVNIIYQHRPDAASKPIKGYLQVLNIVIFLVATIMIIATLIDRNPLILLSGLGAMAAVLMLVFQDTLLSLVASIQLGSNDMVRVGDWIEMPSQNADGDVIDIALHTIKVQNWDRTITTLPTRKLITDAFKNWRGMSDSGGRRIKRAIYLDQRSIRFLNQAEVQHLKEFVLLDDYLKRKQEELAAWNAGLAQAGAPPVNARRITNLGTFRAYVRQYLSNHPSIHRNMIVMVRQLQPGATGLPLEIYCFTNDVRWVAYEDIQADIFDHLLAILPEFDLRVFQQCSDTSGIVLTPPPPDAGGYGIALPRTAVAGGSVAAQE